MCLSVRWRTAHVRVPVCSFLYVWMFADCFGRLGRKSYVAEYSVDAKRLWMAYNYRIVEIYVAIHTPVIPRSFNVDNLPSGVVNTYPSRKRTKG
jgi:hypothetical protein